MGGQEGARPVRCLAGGKREQERAQLRWQARPQDRRLQRGGGTPERPADHLPDGRATGRELVLWQPPDQRDPLALPALEAAAWASPLAAARVAAPPPAAVMMDTGAVVARPTKRRLSWEEADGLQHRKRVRPLEGSTSPNIILPRRSPGTTKRRSFAADPPFDRPAKRPCVAAHC